MRKMNEWAAGLGKSVMVVLLAAVLVAVGVVLATCNVSEPFGDEAGMSLPSDLASPPATDGGAFEGGTSPADADGKASLSMTFTWGNGAAEPARSVAGADEEQIRTGVGTLRNFFQLILVDEAAPDQIWDFAEEKSTPEVARPTLTAGFLINHTYSILILMGHKAGDNIAPTLLASGFLKKQLAAGENRLEIPLTPIVVGAEFTHYDAPADVRQPGRLARAVGLDAGKGYTLVYTLGSGTRPAGGRPEDALQVTSGDGLAPLKAADKAAFHGLNNFIPPDGLRLVDNVARYSFNTAGATADVPDWYDTHGVHSTNGVATYTVDSGAANPNVGSVYFNMVYAPFGLDAPDNWKDRGKFSRPIADVPTWVIRNGLSDAPQDEATDFAAYPADGKNANGAISVGAVDPANGLSGLFEDNNPWPIPHSDMTGSNGDLGRALSALNAVGVKARYGAYTVKLAVNETAAGSFTLGGGGAGAGVYGDLKDVAVIAAAPNGDALGGLGSVTVYDGNSFVDAGAKTQFTVAFNKNGGDTEANPARITVVSPAIMTGATAPATVGTLPAPPTKRPTEDKQYVFAGWNTAAAGLGAPFYEVTPVVADIIVYAQWIEGNPGDVPVTFDPTGGTVSPIVRMVAPGGKIPSADILTPTKEGFAFGGWYTQADGAGARFDENYVVTGALTVYAKWTAKSYNISYKDADASSSGTAYSGSAISSPTTHTYGTLTALPAVTKNGFVFGGWYTESPATDANRVLNLAATTYTADITLYAKWAEQWTISYNANGGTDGAAPPSAQHVAPGSFAAAQNHGTMTSSDKIFNGWKTAHSSGTDYAVGQAVWPTADMTLYAQWAASAAPSIGGQPQDAGWGLSEPTTPLSVTASGPGLSYQWYTSSTSPVDIAVGNKVPSGGTAATYTPPPSAIAGQVYYRVRVTNTANYADSNTATVSYLTLKDRVEAATGTVDVKLYQDERVSNNLAIATAIPIAGGKTITLLSSNGTERTVEIAAAGTTMFAVDGGPTASLILGNGVTLKGRAGNTSALVRVTGGSKLYMNDSSARIIGNENTSNTTRNNGTYPVDGGGAVYVSDSGSIFTMSAGTIGTNGTIGTEANSAMLGSGVYVKDNGTFTMSGGVITGNIGKGATSTFGSGAYIAKGTFMMSGNAAITGNETTGTGIYSTGGGLYLRDSIAVMSSGTISGNDAYSGGGVVVYGTTTFLMNAGEIYGNAASGNTGLGGGVYLNGNGTFDMRGGTIGSASGGARTNNTAGKWGGGVYLVGTSASARAILTLRGGAVIGGNTAVTQGGGVYCTGTGTFAMSKSTVYGQAGSAVPTVVSSTNTVPAEKANTVTGTGAGKTDAFYGIVTFNIGNNITPSYNGTTVINATETVTSDTTVGGPGSLTLAVAP
jgi:uncharacterized repeat protein (TIGR02543 family)